MHLSRPATLVAAVAVLALTATGVALATTQRDDGVAEAGVEAVAVAAATAGTADERLAAELAFAREEERMARDLYAALAAQLDGARPFSTITTSEQRHFEAVGTLLDAYGVPDPAEARAPGDYAEPEIQALYDGWLARGLSSAAEAFQVGVELEQRDIADLEATLAGLDDGAGLDDVERVLTSLLAGSQNHLAAFQRAADRAS